MYSADKIDITLAPKQTAISFVTFICHNYVFLPGTMLSGTFELAVV